MKHLKTVPLPPKYLIFLEKFDAIFALGFLTKMEEFQERLDNVFGENFTDILQKIGDVLSLGFINIVLLIIFHLIMKCLAKKRKSSRFLTFFKSMIESFYSNLRWSAFYLLLIDGYKDLLEHLI